MESITPLNPGPKIALAQIAQAENTLGACLPEDYKHFMLNFNGGIIGLSFKLKDGKPGSTLDSLYGIGDNCDEPILEANETRAGRMPRGYVAIGPDPGGNVICLDCNPGPGYGNVYFWDHDFEIDDSDREEGLTPEDAGNCHLIADSFTEFLACLYELVLPPIQPGRVINTSTPEMKARFESLMKRRGLK